MFHVFMDILFPQHVCCLCRKPGRYGSRHPWCNDCHDSMVNTQLCLPVCSICGKYLQGGCDLCSDCRERTPAFTICRAVGPYSEPAYRIAVKVLKFMGRKHLAYQMGKMMAQVVAGEPRFWPIDLILPVPSSRSSFKNRGFNQTELLAKQISRFLNLTVNVNLLKRVKETPHQRGLSKEEREKNLLYAFEINDNQKIYQKNILLVDDIYTTGSTVRECTRVLMESGASRAAVITWATGVGY